MKLATILLSAIVSGIFLTSLTACQTESPGATYALGAYSTNIDAAPDKVTTAAKKAASDLNLAEVAANGTKVDGTLTAKTAQGDPVTIEISQAGDNVSKVTIRVGTTGDQAISKELVDKIKSHLSWF